jgi:hypothetical protein
MLNRRQFLRSVAAAATGLVAWRYIGSSDVEAIVAVLHKRLHYLQLESNGVYAFANDLIERQIVSSGKLRLLDMAGPLYTQLSPYLTHSPLTQGLNNGEERIVSLYLLSSDFFRNGYAVAKPVRYLEFYEPFAKLSPCQNPFARPLNYSAG